MENNSTRRTRSVWLASLASVSLFQASIAAAGAFTQQAPPSAAAAPAVPPAAPAPIVIDDATPIKVQLQTEMKSGVAKEGDQVPFLVEEDVRGGSGRVLIKAGTPAFGRVLESSHRGYLGKPGKLEFTCDYIALPDRSRVALRSKQKTKYGQDNRAADVTAAVLLTPVALLIKGNDVTARKGAEFTMYVERHPDQGIGTASSATLPGKPAGRSAYLLNDGTSVVGTLVKFDGLTYSVRTDSGDRDLKAADVKSVSPVQ